MGRNKLRKSILMIITATVVAGNLVFAEGAKNCITDLKLNNDGRNVKVDIYTNKPYSEPVVVNKREGNKYVILIPETVSSVKTMPKVSGGGNVSVNMQTISAGKGYTKITITSDKVVNVIPKTITSTGAVPVKSTNTVAKSQPTKPAATAQKTTSTTPKTVASASKPAATQKPNSVAATQKPKTTTTASKPASVQKPSAQKATSKPSTSAQKPVAKPPVSAQKPKVATTAVKPKVLEPAKPVQAVPASGKNSVEPINKPLQILEQEVIADKSSDIKEHVSDSLLDKTIKENDEIIKQRKLMRMKRRGKQIKKPFDDRKLSVGETIKLVLDNMRMISLWKLLLLAGAITFPIIVIMIILNLDKRINKRIGAIKKEDDVVLMERALRDNVNAVRAQKAAQQAREESEPYNSIDDILDRVDDTVELPNTYSDVDVVEPMTVVDSSDFMLDEPVVAKDVDETLSAHDFGFGNGLSDGADVVDGESVSLDEFSGGTFVDSAFEEGDLKQEVVPYNPDGVLADYSNVNDQEFFDELVLQSFAESDVDSLPENTPSDEIFEYMTDADTGVMLADFGHSHFEQEQDEEEVVESDTSVGDVTMLTEAKINDRTGLYLVNYDNYSSLVGHISDDYFVLKTFDGLVSGNITLKPTEKSRDSMRYLVRVGRNKMIVEVNDYSMSRLIDL